LSTPRVFISYRQIGTTLFAQLLHSELQAEPLSLRSKDVFWDRRHIRGGEDFEAKVWAAVEATEVLVVLLDENWLNDTDENGKRRIDHEGDFCRQELEKALLRRQAGDRVEIIPVCCNGFKLPKKEDLPASLQDVLALLHMKLDTQNSVQLSRDLVQRIGECLGLEDNSARTISLSSQPTLIPTIQLSDTSLSLQGFAIESLQTEIANLAGVEASRLTADLLSALRRRDVHLMAAARVDLADWLSNRGSKATKAIRCKVRTFLAEAEFSHVAAMHEDGAPFRTDTIRQLANQALQELADEVEADDRERLLCLMARLDFIDGHETKALASLGESTSPLPFKFRLIMLQELGRLEEANDLLQGVEPSRRWTDVAVPIRFMSGHEDKAAELLEWTISNGDEVAAHHCRLAMARCLHDKPLRRFRGTGKISPAKLTAEELDQLGEVLKTLDAVIQPAIARGRPENGLEIEALEIAIPVAHLRSDREAARQFAKILALARPASTQAAQAFLWGYLPYSAELVANLRADRPTSFDANFLAMTMEFDSGVQAATLVEKINALWSLAKDDEDRTQLAGFLVHFVPELPEELRQTVVERLERALGSDHEIARLVRARQLLVAGRAENAKMIADAHRTENPEWDLLLADIAESLKDDATALQHLLKAAETVTHPDLFWRAAIAASRLRDWSQTIKLLQTVVKLAPDRLKARRQLFQACMRDGSQEAMRLALEQMETFEKAEPDVLEHVLNQAIVLMHLQEFTTALSLLDELLKRSSPERSEDSWLRLSAILHKVRIIGTDSPAEAFSLLSSDSVRTEFRNQVAFWQARMQLGHRAGQDAAAHEAMEQIQKLEEGLSDDQKSLWAPDIEDLKEIVEARGKFLRELRSLVTSGRSTLSFVAMEENRPLVQEMIFRSQPMIVPETEEHHGRFVTYASNGVILSPKNSGFHVATDPACPHPKSGIVIDPTSILTLHRLGLLDTALARFEHIRVPGHMIARFIEVVEKLQPHQRSSHDAMLEVERLVNSGGVRITPHTSGQVIVEFDGEKGPSGIGIRHVINWLYGNGQIGEDDFEQLQPLHFDDSGTAEQLGAAIASGPIHATTQALTALARQRLLDSFVAKLTVCITEETRQEIVQSAKSYREFDDLRVNYGRMIEKLKSAPNVEFDGFRVQAPEGDSREEQLQRRWEEAALSVRLAKGQREHLLADDRACQQMLANERESSVQEIFSTWQLVETLYDENRITMPTLAEACLKLMAWRYRFFVPRADVLLHWALQYRASYPGQPLRDVATYMMDCFAGPGLLHGLEPTSPPFTNSSRLFQRWIDVITHLIAEVWRSGEFSPVQKTEVTVWSLRNLSPFPATYASGDEQVRLSGVATQVILSKLMSRLSSLNLRNDQAAALFKVCISLMSSEERKRFDELHWSYREVGGDREPSVDLKAEELDATLDPAHRLRSRATFWSPAGPLCLLNDTTQERAGLIWEMPKLLLHPDEAARNTGIEYLRRLKDLATTVISEFSSKLVEELRATILLSESSEWRPAAMNALGTLERDFSLNLAGFGQSLPLPKELQDTRNEYAKRVLYPPDHPAKYVSRETFDVMATAAEWKERVDDCIVSGEVQRSIQTYVLRFHHLPLDGVYSLVEIIRNHFSISEAVPNLLELSKDAHPLNQLLGCRTLCQLWCNLTAEQQAEALKSIETFLSLLFTEPTSLEGHLWQCRKLLVRHYLYQCELYEPGWPPDAITGLAWKLADMVMDVITPHAGKHEDSISYVQRVGDEVVRPMMQARELVARLIRSPSGQSLYRLASLDETFGSPFGIGLLCGIEPAIPDLLKSETAGPVLKRAMSKLIMANGPFLPASQSVLFETARDQWSRLVGAWLQNEHAPDREALSECVAQYTEFIDVANLTETLRMLPEADKETRVSLLYQIDRLAVLDQLPNESLWQVFSDATFQQSMLKTFDDDNLKYIINAIVTVQQSQSPEWSWQLPYAFLNALKLASTAESIERLVGGLLASTCHRHAYSILSRIAVPEFPSVVVDKLRLYIQTIQFPEKALPSYARMQIRQITMRALR
jgi:hypothetical protein